MKVIGRIVDWVGPQEDRAHFARLYPSVLVNQVSATLMGAVNTMMSGNVSLAVLSGVGQADVLISMFAHIAETLAVGGTVVSARHLGAGDKKGASHCAGQAILFGAVPIAVLSAFFAVFRVPFLTLLFGRVEPQVMKASADYMTMAALSLPCSFLFSQLSGIFRSTGDSKTPLKAGLVMNGANLALGAFFIAGVGSYGGYGAFGAGIAIFCSRALGALLLVVCTVRSPRAVKPGWQRGQVIDLAAMAEVCRIALPAAFESGMYYLGRLAIQVLVSGMGTLAISAYQIYTSIHAIAVMPLDSVNISAVPIMGQRHGEGSRQRCAHTIQSVIRIGKLVQIGVTVLMLLSPPIIMLYTREVQAARMAYSLLFIHAFNNISWPWSWLLPHCFRGVGYVRRSAWVSPLTTWTLKVGLSYLLAIVFRLGVYSVIIGLAAECTMRAVIFYRTLRSGIWLSGLPS